MPYRALTSISLGSPPSESLRTNFARVWTRPSKTRLHASYHYHVNRGRPMETKAPTKTWTYFEENWYEGNTPIMGSRTHAAWLCSLVFDGARAFEGVTPDLELHCARVNESAAKMFLKPIVSVDTWMQLAKEGIARFGHGAALYIRPMYWAEKGGPWIQEP